MPKNILLVDDNAVELTVLSDFLQKDYNVICAESGKDMLSVLRTRAKTISAIFLDTMMPDMDGFEALHKIKENALYRQIPVIMTTSLNDEASQVKAMSLGANGYVSKPYNADLIRFTLNNAITLRETSGIVNTFRKDTLTGIYNRAYFFEMAEVMLRHSQPCSYILACLDIENFKVINDQYGTKTGDKILKHIADAINRCASELDGLCCRYSADNFGMLYPSKYKDSELIRKLHKEIIATKHLGNTIKIRIGRYLADDISVPINAMYDRASLAEQSIRGRYDTFIAEYDASMRTQLLTQQRIVNDMHTALANGEFSVMLQPQYNHSDGAIIGAEALVRWKKGDEFISPADFIPIFERNGFIYEMDQYVWGEVCKLLRSELDSGKAPLPISVNISRRDLFHAHFIEVFTGIVNSCNIPYELLRLEVTESAFAESSGQIIAKVNKLIELGFVVEIDDFGSGYSSLNTLKDVTASILKLDMRFFEHTENSQRGGNIVESVVRMAKWLGMSVIAEGVEEKVQADYLKSIGCYYIQGYFYAKPMSVADYEILLAENRKEPKLTQLQTLDNLDSNEFWNPKSMDTLIFNSFVGAACILEFFNGKIEILRASELFVKILNSTTLNVKDILHLSWEEHMDSRNICRFSDAMRESMQTHKTVTKEFEFINIPGCVKKMYMRISLRVIASTGDRSLIYCLNDNITAQMEAERKQLESANRLEIIMSNVSGGVSAIRIKDDKTSEFIFCNEKYYELYGYTREEVMREHIDVLSLIVPEDLASVMEKVRTLYETGIPTIIDYRIKKRNGTLAYIRANASLMSIDGYDDVITSVVTDITEKKLLEGQLAAIIENINGGVSAIYMRSDKPEFLFVNDCYFDVIGYTREQFDAEVKSIFDIIHPDDCDRVKKQVKESFRYEKKCTMEYRIICRNKSVKSIICNTSLIHLFGLDEAVQLAISTDITEMRDKESQLKLLTSAIPGGIASYSISGDKIQLLYCNDGFYEFSDYSREEYLNMTSKDALIFVYEEDRPKILAMIKELRENKTSDATGDCTFRCHTRSGKLRWLRIKAAISPVDNNRLVMHVVQLDITKQLEAEGKQLELLDNLPCGAGMYEFDGKNLTAFYINKQYEVMVNRTFNSSNTELLPMNYIHPDDCSVVNYELRDAIANNRNAYCNIRLLCENDTYRLFHLDVKIVSQLNGKYMLYVAYSRITEQEMTFKNILPFIFSTIMESSTDLAFAKDANFRYICCSKTFAMLLGLGSERDVIGKTDYELFPPEIADMFRRDDSELLATEMPKIDVIEQIPTPNGRFLYTKTSKHLLRNTSGDIVGIYSIGRDITETREAYAQLKLLTNSIPGGIATLRCTRDKIELSYYNDGLCKLFGFTRNEYNKKSIDPTTLVFDEDKYIIIEKRSQLLDNPDESVSCIFRIHSKDGGCKWTSCVASAVDRINNTLIVNAVLTDITEQQEEKEQLQLHDEEYRLATEHSNRSICRYDISSRTLRVSSEVASRLSLPEYIEDVPYGQVMLGLLSDDTSGAYISFYEKIMSGESENTATFCYKLITGWRWISAHATTAFGKFGKPVSAVISFVDVTEEQEKEQIYKRWRHELSVREPSSYTLFQINLNQNTSYDSRDGLLLDFFGKPNDSLSFNEITRLFVESYVFIEDRQKYLDFLDSDKMLASYYRNKRAASIEFRLTAPQKDSIWVRLFVELVEYSNTKDVQAYLMYEDINDAKLSELKKLEQAENDPLTGLLNRSTFENKVNAAINASKEDSLHAFLIIAVNGFKLVNDVFGRGACDQAQIDISGLLSKSVRRDDFVGRLGEDEFLVFLSNIQSEKIAINKAQQICEAVRKSFSPEVQLSGNVGIALYPRDGGQFEALYKKADKMLCYVKDNGKTDFFTVGNKSSVPKNSTQAVVSPKRRMLIVDDSRVNHAVLSGLFCDSFTIEHALDGASALAKLQHFGSSVSVVLLDLLMPGVNGFDVLEKMQKDANLSSIPVVVVSSEDNSETVLRVIRNGASDYITKPIEPDILRIRVESAISKADNEKLRAQNSFLLMQNNEIKSYTDVLEKLGMFVITFNPINEMFTYSPSVSNHLFGKFDNRSLWDILLSDAVADSRTVQRLKQLVKSLADDKSRTEDSVSVVLKSAAEDKRSYEINICKQINEYGLADKLLMTFKEE